MAKENKKIVSKLSHIEVVVEDPAATAKYMEEIFGAVRVEKQFSQWLASHFGAEEGFHMQMGGVVYQLVPKYVPGSWGDSYEKDGPNIHNISIQVHNAQKVVDELVAAGAEIIYYWPKYIDFAEAGYSVEGGPRDAWLIDATKLCGMRIEIAEDLPEWEPGEQD